MNDEDSAAVAKKSCTKEKYEILVIFVVNQILWEKGKNTFIALHLKNVNKKFEFSAKPLNVIIFQISLHQ